MLKRRRGNARVLVGYGNVLSEWGRLEEALVFYRRAARIDRKSPWVQYNWGLCLQRLGHFGRAIRRYRKAYEASADWVRALAQIAECFRLDNQMEKAKESFLAYLQEVPDDDYERVNLGTVYSDTEEYDKAVAEFEKALAGGNCESAFVRYNWGVTALRMGDFKMAEAQLEGIKTESPHCPGASLLEAQMACAAKAGEASSAVWRAIREARESEDDEWRMFAYVQAMHLFRVNELMQDADLLFDQANRTEDLTPDLLDEYREAFGKAFEGGATYQVLLECFRETETVGASTEAPSQRYYRNLWVCAPSREEAVRLACDFEKRLGAGRLDCRQVAKLEALTGAWKAGVYRVSSRTFFQRPGKVGG
jgi:tetratricopeptide (TPR) repeat protein